MSDLISREALLRKMEERYCKIDNGRAFKGMTIPVVDGVRMNEIEFCIGMIQSEDAIEAEPVRHGRWYRDPTNENYFCCSVCDGANGLWHQFADCRYEFCPWCGAKMDGGAEDD